jgi:hypothetical protein
MLQNIVVPEAENRIAASPHEFVAFAVVHAFGVLAAIDFDDEFLFSAAEVGEVRSDGKLTGEFVSTQLAVLQFNPKQSFGLIISLSQASRSFCGADLAPAPSFNAALPHSVAALRRHLSPTFVG